MYILKHVGAPGLIRLGYSSQWTTDTWLSQSRRFLNANYANQRMMRIYPRKFAKFAYSWHSRSKPAGLSGDFEKTITTDKTTLPRRKLFYDKTYV